VNWCFLNIYSWIRITFSPTPMVKLRFMCDCSRWLHWYSKHYIDGCVPRFVCNRANPLGYSGIGRCSWYLWTYRLGLQAESTKLINH
jgi:hypothetical protein